MTMQSKTTIYLNVGDPPTVKVGHALGQLPHVKRGWLSIMNDDERAELTIHFDDPQQVVDFAAALVEAVLPEPRQLPVIDMGCYPPIHVMAEHSVQHRDLSDAGTDRLIADLRDGHS